ncbi:MAG: hypothetical protein AVDCRST_MAG54-1370, partial [uncultured Actinomycetospora sp.]
MTALLPEGLGRMVVVVPTYNEVENLAEIAERLLRAVPTTDLLVVDDSSPDGTGPIVEELAVKFPGRVELLTRNWKQGIGRAYVAGFTRALETDAPLIAQMDADHSHQPSDLA